MLTAIQLACQTKFTREGVRDMSNRKPYRTKKQKEVARDMAWRHNGTWVSSAPVSYHPPVK